MPCAEYADAARSPLLQLLPVRSESSAWPASPRRRGLRLRARLLRDPPREEHGAVEAELGLAEVFLGQDSPRRRSPITGPRLPSEWRLLPYISDPSETPDAPPLRGSPLVRREGRHERSPAESLHDRPPTKRRISRGRSAAVRGLVDELVVVDTGVERPYRAGRPSLGARVESFEWCDDFAARAQTTRSPLAEGRVDSRAGCG